MSFCISNMNTWLNKASRLKHSWPSKANDNIFIAKDNTVTFKGVKNSIDTVLTNKDQAFMRTCGIMQPSSDVNYSMMHYVEPTYNTTNENRNISINSTAGIYVAPGKQTGGGNISNSYGTYISAPSYGKNRVPLYSDGISVGNPHTKIGNAGIVSTKKIVIGGGDANNPDLSFTKDPNSGIHLSSPGNLEFKVNNKDVIHVAQKNVTIAADIDMSKSRCINLKTTNTTAGLIVGTDGSTSDTSLNMAYNCKYNENSGKWSKINQELPTSRLSCGSDGIGFNVGENEGVRIKSDGKIGFGISTPEHALHLASDDVVLPSSSTWKSVADSRVKENIEDADTFNSVNIIKNLNLKSFNYRREYADEYKLSNTQKHIGFVAQDVEKILPECVKLCSKKIGSKEIEDFRILDTDQINKHLVGAVQNLINTQDDLQKKVIKMGKKKSVGQKHPVHKRSGIISDSSDCDTELEDILKKDISDHESIGSNDTHNSCMHMYTKGKKSGTQCTVQPKDNSKFCYQHRKSKEY